MADTKLTNVKAIEIAISMLDSADFSEVSVDKEEFMEKMGKIKTSFEARNTSKAGKPSKAHTENEALAKQAYELMEIGVAYSTTELGKLLGGLSTQKTSPVGSILADGVKVTKTSDKGKTIYTKIA